MKITIDTTVDSKEDIMKAIQLLSDLSGKKSSVERRNLFNNSGAGLFGSNEQDNYMQSLQSNQSSLQESVQQQSPQSNSGFMSMFGDVSPIRKEIKKEDEDESPEHELSGLMTY